MYGPDVNTLMIETQPVGGPASVIFEKKGTLDDKWYQGQVNVKDKSPYILKFTGIRGVFYQGDIALDDISLNAGKCASTQCKSPNLFNEN
jgi:hypothetical protein